MPPYLSFGYLPYHEFPSPELDSWAPYTAQRETETRKDYTYIAQAKYWRCLPLANSNIKHIGYVSTLTIGKEDPIVLQSWGTQHPLKYTGVFFERMGQGLVSILKEWHWSPFKQLSVVKGCTHTGNAGLMLLLTKEIQPPCPVRKPSSPHQWAPSAVLTRPRT